jgi:single-strand DNA-binding protein
MPRSVNKVILLGHIGRDAETHFTPNGIAVTKFSVATTHSWKSQSSDEWEEETNWTNVVLWRSENLASYLTKGQQVYLEGRLQNRSYEDKEGRRVYTSEVISDEIVLLGGSKERTSVAAGLPAGPSRLRFAQHGDKLERAVPFGYRQTRLCYCAPCA